MLGGRVATRVSGTYSAVGHEENAIDACWMRLGRTIPCECLGSFLAMLRSGPSHTTPSKENGSTFFFPVVLRHRGNLPFPSFISGTSKGPPPPPPTTATSTHTASRERLLDPCIAQTGTWARISLSTHTHTRTRNSHSHPQLYILAILVVSGQNLIY